MNKNNIIYTDSFLDLTIICKSMKSNNMSDGHIHPSHEIYYLSRGSRIFIINGKMLNVLQGSIVVIPPYIPHQVLNTTVSSYRSFIVNLTANTVPAHQQYKFKKDSSVLSNDYIVLKPSKKEIEMCERLSKSAHSELLSQSNNHEIMLYGIALEMLTLCQRIYDATGEQVAVVPLAEATRIDLIIRFINERYYDNLSLQRLADSFFVSPSYLSRRFKKETGISIVDYINSVRIQKAISLFLNSKNSVSAVAKKCGFTSTQNFNRVFKQITGCPPSHYKKIGKSTTPPLNQA